jgi:hypothetical protein
MMIGDGRVARRETRRMVGWSIACPACGAAAGQHCVQGGTTLIPPHLARAEQALRVKRLRRYNGYARLSR